MIGLPPSSAGGCQLNFIEDDVMSVIDGERGTVGAVAQLSVCHTKIGYSQVVFQILAKSH